MGETLYEKDVPSGCKGQYFWALCPGLLGGALGEKLCKATSYSPNELANFMIRIYVRLY